MNFTNLYGQAGFDGVTYPSIGTMNGLLTQQANDQYQNFKDKVAEVLSYVDKAFPADGKNPMLNANDIRTVNNYLGNGLSPMSQTLEILLGSLIGTLRTGF